MACLRESEEDNLKDGELHKHEKQFLTAVISWGGLGKVGLAFTYFFIIDFKRRKWCNNG